MKLVTVFLLVAIGLCSYSNALSLLSPLKPLLDGLGISVEHLVTGLGMCVNELGPEASEAVKTLLGALS
ncbi:secretoglobin family 3A member 2-like [Molossus molossus]|uniref:secretoglobin family 3A member 2-like n=1 Tax=Molossus molossus TaxID=27622 RepID=UPI0017460211|nr:secretoglobin family 3A member 2-like [Molossus molossus]